MLSTNILTVYRPAQKQIDTGVIIKPSGQVKPRNIDELSVEVLLEASECYFERVNDDDEETAINTSPSNKCWRLVYDGTTVMALFESEGETWTINNLFCAETKQECLDYATQNGLSMEMVDENQYIS